MNFSGLDDRECFNMKPTRVEKNYANSSENTHSNYLLENNLILKRFQSDTENYDVRENDKADNSQKPDDVDIALKEFLIKIGR